MAMDDDPGWAFPEVPVSPAEDEAWREREEYMRPVRLHALEPPASPGAAGDNYEEAA